MDHALDLVTVKAVGALTALGVPARARAGWAGLHAVRLRDAFSPGLVILAAMAHVAERVPGRTGTLALAQGVASAAGDAAGRAPHRYPTPPWNGNGWPQRRAGAGCNAGWRCGIATGPSARWRRSWRWERPLSA